MLRTCILRSTNDCGMRDCRIASYARYTYSLTLWLRDCRTASYTEFSLRPRKLNGYSEIAPLFLVLFCLSCANSASCSSGTHLQLPHPRIPSGRSWGGRKTGANVKWRRRGRGRGEKEKGRKELFSPRPLPLRCHFPLAPILRPPHDLPLGIRGCSCQSHSRDIGRAKSPENLVLESSLCRRGTIKLRG